MGAVADASRRLLFDQDGRPLTALFIAGRRILGGADQAIDRDQLEALHVLSEEQKEMASAEYERRYGKTLLRLAEHFGECSGNRDETGLVWLVESLSAIIRHSQAIMDRPAGELAELIKVSRWDGQIH